MRQFATYAVILMLIIVAGVATLMAVGQNANKTFGTVKNAFPAGS